MIRCDRCGIRFEPRTKKNFFCDDCVEVKMAIRDYERAYRKAERRGVRAG